MNNRLKMLEVSIDEDSDNEIQVASKPAINFSSNDRFQSAAVTKGLFFSQDDEVDYQFIPIVPVSKQQEMFELKTNHPAIKMINEIDYDSYENQIQKEHIQTFSKHESEEQKNKHEEGEANTQENFTNFVKPALSHRMLEIALSDDDSSESKTEQNQEKKQQKQEKVQNSKNPQPSLNSECISQLHHDDLLQNVTDINEFSRSFSQTAIPKGKYIQLLLARNNSGLNKIWPEFGVYIGDSRIIAAKKMVGCTTSNFYITTEQGIQNVQHLNFLAKMRANFSGAIYHVFDKGVNPQKGSKFNKIRSILATVRFRNIVLSNEPRQFEVFVLKNEVSYFDLEGVIFQKQIGLDVLYDKFPDNRGKIYAFKNRKPIFSTTLKGFILNFGGRVQLPSIKNFILQEPEKKREVLMLGKSGEDLFRVDISWPITPSIAICICLANFDSKFLSE